MPHFEVRLLDAGAVSTRRIEARDAQDVASVLAVPPSRILGVSRVSDAPPARGLHRSGRRPAVPLRQFSKELAVLLGAGIPLLEAIVTLQEKEGATTTVATLGAVADRLCAGEALSVALGAQPDAFDALFVAVVSSAERTGQLREALQAHSDYLAWVQALRDRLVGASIYPLMLVFIGSAVMLFLMIYVVPRFAGILEGVGGDIPAASRALLSLGLWTGSHPFASAAAAVALLAAPWLAWQHPALRDRAIGALWSVPVLAGRLRLLALARLYRTLSMLVCAGVPVVAALRTARGVIAPHLRVALDAVGARVARGERLSDALLAEGLTTPVSVRMLRVGERSGRVGTLLGDAAAFYDEELARLTDTVTRMVSPLLMLLMGVLIGSVVVLMYLPIFQLMESVQ